MTNFKHISVNTQPDEEVIRVGGEGSSTSVIEYPAGFDGSGLAGEPENTSAVVERAEPEASQAQSKMQQSQAGKTPPSSAPSPSKKKAKGSEYAQTTLDDLNSVKMSTVQKAVIAVAVLALAAFAVWFFGFGGKI